MGELFKVNVFVFKVFRIFYYFNLGKLIKNVFRLDVGCEGNFKVRMFLRLIEWSYRLLRWEDWKKWVE